MSEQEKKEKVTGIWAETGKEVSFNRVWAGHRFTDDEVSDLLAGRQIEISGLKSRTGNSYGVIGRLAEQEYNDSTFVGFLREDFVDQEGVPNVWCKHRFTASEKETLESGGTIEIKNAVSKKGKKFDCQVKYDVRNDGTKGIIPIFD